jgi:pimeloyl-ACP methyl ester carboxylesterase
MSMLTKWLLAVLGAGVVALAIWPEQRAAIVLTSTKYSSLAEHSGMAPISADLRRHGYTVTAFDLPCHSEGRTDNGLECWRERLEAGETDIFEAFCNELSEEITRLNYRRIQIVGVSRGGFIAAICAAMDERITELGLIAPVTDLSVLTEFDGFAGDVDLTLGTYVPALKHRNIMIRIGRSDDRVSTASAQAFAGAVKAELQILDVEGHSAPDPTGEMADWLVAMWPRLF